MGPKSFVPWLTVPRQAVCAEIGVWKGGGADRILRTGRVRELHLVDPWVYWPEFPGRLYGGSQAKSQVEMDAIADSVRRKFAAAPEVRVHRGRSVEVAAGFPDRYFDWVYIDGDHSAQAAFDDLVAWYPKVKIGRAILLDDYYWRDEARRLSVKDAADRSVAAYGIRRWRQFGGPFLLRVEAGPAK